MTDTLHKKITFLQQCGILKPRISYAYSTPGIYSLTPFKRFMHNSLFLFGPMFFARKISSQLNRETIPIKIYIQIPFCSKRCLFCHCNSIEPRTKNELTDYVTVLLDDLKQTHKKLNLSKKKINLIGIGGGCPSLLNEANVERLLRTITSLFLQKDSDTIFTMELSIPDLLLQNLSARLELLKKYGINRLSVGVQSFCDDKLKFLRCRYNCAQALECIRTIRKHGFKLNIDLMYGIDKEPAYHYEKDCEVLQLLDVNAVAVYRYGSYNVVHAGLFKESSDEAFYQAYAAITSLLVKKGFHMYAGYMSKEVETVHQEWIHRFGTMIGIGYGAVSFNEKMWWRNVNKMSIYKKMVRAKQLPIHYIRDMSRSDICCRNFSYNILSSHSFYYDNYDRGKYEKILRPMIDNNILCCDNEHIWLNQEYSLFNVPIMFNAIERLQNKNYNGR